MEKYDQLSIVGEGSYGVVMKCRHRDSDQIVAIKKFLETEEDATVRRMALREIRMLKKLKHENLVTMIEVFRYRKRFYLVFEYVEGTILDELEKMPNGLGEDRTRERVYQLVRALNYCHNHHVIHRDVKPENVLVSSRGIVKLCDFGFARLMSLNGEQCTEYVATRWYRAPELLVGELNYGPPVDVWGVGCLFYEIMTGDPLFPGESDIDQLYLILKTVGKPCPRHEDMMLKNANLRGLVHTAPTSQSVFKTLTSWSMLALNFLIYCLRMDPVTRPTAEDILKHNFFTHDRFPQKFLPALREKVLLEFGSNPLLRRFKTDVLMATDTEYRRPSFVEPPKWKIQVQDTCVKRKLSCDTMNLENVPSTRFSNAFLRSNLKLKETQKVLYARDSKDVLKQSDADALDVDFVEQQLQQVSLEAAASREESAVPSTEVTPKGSMATSGVSASGNSDVGEQSGVVSKKSSVNFGAKKPANILQSLATHSMKTAYGQVPFLNPSPKSQHFFRRLNKNADAKSSCSGGSSWLNTLPPYYGKSKDVKPKSDVFTLPNVPGASSSPKNNSLTVTSDGSSPDNRYKKTKRKYASDARLPSLTNTTSTIKPTVA